MPGNNFNPNFPSTIGFEWLVNTYGTAAIGPWAQRIRSTGAETINRLDALAGATVSDPSRLLAEIIPAGNEIPSGTVQVAKYEPNSDAIATGWSSSSLTTTNLWSFIDEGVDTFDVSDWISGPVGFLANDYRPSFASAGFSSSARVLDLTFRFRVSASTAAGSILLVAFMQSGGFTRYLPFGYQVVCSAVYPATQLVEVSFGEINPATGLPWTTADIQGFDTGTALNFLDLQEAIPATASAILVAAEMQVTYQTVENRVACAVRKKSDTVNRFPAFCALPGGAASWSKPASGDFSVLFRPVHDAFGAVAPQQFSMQWLASATQDCVVPGVVSARPSVDIYGQVTSVDFLGDTNARTIAVLLWNNGPAISNDSLPYALANDTAHLPYMDLTTTLTQTFTGATGSYSFVKLVLDPQAATNPLLVKIRRVSDNVQFGSTGTADPDDVRAQDPVTDNWRNFTVPFSSPAVLVAGTRYYVELSTVDPAPFGTGWRTTMAGDSGLAGGTATFQGTTDFASNAGVAKPDFDIPFKLIIPPAAPTGLAAAVTQTPNNVHAAAQNCVPGTISAATITWNATALGGIFGAYHIQRGVAANNDWVDVATIDTESTHTWIDYELKRNTNQQYRIAVERADGVESVWSSATASVVAPTHGCEVLFTSNADPTLNCAYDYEPGLEYTFTAASRDEIVEIYGSNFAVAFKESEDPGITFPITLTVNFGVTPSVSSVAIFDPIRTISRAAIPYVCVMDWAGNQFFALVQLPKGTWDTPEAFAFHAQLQITEISGVPSPAVAS